MIAIYDKKPSQSEKILFLIALSGEVPKTALRRLDIPHAYQYKVIAKLKADKLIRIYKKDGIASYRLTVKGKNQLSNNNPLRFNKFLYETRTRSELSRRLRSHAAAQVIITLLHCGIIIYLDEKPQYAKVALPLQSNLTYFYSSIEYKSNNNEFIKVRSSRAIGIVFHQDKIYIIYNTGSTPMKWEYQTEIRLKTLLSMNHNNCNVYGIMTGDNMNAASQILKNQRDYKHQTYSVDESFQRMYFIPNDSNGELQLSCLLSKSIKTKIESLLLSDLISVDKNVSYDALTKDGIPVLLSLQFDLIKLKKFISYLSLSDKHGIIYCYDFQKITLKVYANSLIDIKTIDSKKIKRRFFS